MQHNSPESLQVNFARDKEAAYQSIYKRSPIVSSMSVGWDELSIAYDWYPIEKVPKITSEQHGISIFTDMTFPVITEREIGAELKREEVIQGWLPDTSI